MKKNNQRYLRSVMAGRVTPGELAKLLGVKRVTVYAWCRGSRAPDLFTALKLYAHLMKRNGKAGKSVRKLPDFFLFTAKLACEYRGGA